MIELLTDPQAWAALVTLTAMEIILGIDNIVFISVLVARLPKDDARRARTIGLMLALVFRIVLLFALTWLIGLTDPVISGFGLNLSWRDLILIAGGLYLVYKGTGEIHERIEGGGEHESPRGTGVSLIGTIVQIALLDIVFSLDSVIMAFGMASQLPVMMAAVIIAVGVMMLASAPVAGFVNRHPTVKMLALSFLLLIGMTLIADGFGAHVPRGYIYAAIGFSLLVELLNQLAGSRRRRLRSSAGD